MSTHVQNFISNICSISPSENLTETFTCGACYWFARILCERFAEDGAELCYDAVENHFVARINERLYDITGDVTGKYEVIPWSQFDDELEKARIERDCIKLNG